MCSLYTQSVINSKAIKLEFNCATASAANIYSCDDHLGQSGYSFAIKLIRSIILEGFIVNAPSDRVYTAAASGERVVSCWLGEAAYKHPLPGNQSSHKLPPPRPPSSSSPSLAAGRTNDHRGRPKWSSGVVEKKAGRLGPLPLVVSANDNSSAQQYDLRRRLAPVR